MKMSILLTFEFNTQVIFRADLSHSGQVCGIHKVSLHGRSADKWGDAPWKYSHLDAWTLGRHLEATPSVVFHIILSVKQAELPIEVFYIPAT